MEMADKGSKAEAGEVSNLTRPPEISLPKGGGAIRGMGEKFAANPVTGTGSMSVPIATSPGRAGFGPQLSLSYDSASGNGPFGLGWSLSLPSITRKTDKGLPRYQDSAESDVFILSGAEDLVPELNADGSRYLDTATVPGFSIRRYRPRIEGLFARIERWTNAQGVSHWRSISKDNITTLYGRTAESCIVDPADEKRIFSWLICESYDDKGNAIRYEYKRENSQGIVTSSAHEANRSDTGRTANRYIKRIKYGNQAPRQAGEDLSSRNDWMFEAVFDYGEHYAENADGEIQSLQYADNLRDWDLRQDAFSSYRAGYEVRTYRLCQRALMFHHFDELVETNYLVRASHFAFSRNDIASFITGVTQTGYKLIDGSYQQKSLPPTEFEYSQAIIQERVLEVDPASMENLPQGLDNSRYQWVDLDGEGLSGILTEQGGAWFYKRNESALPLTDSTGNVSTVARFAPQEFVATMPSTANLSAGQQLLDLAGDGQLDVVEFDGATPGFFERTTDEDWDTHRPFTSLPNISWRDPNLKFIDLTGDGHADLLITEDEAFSWYPSLAEAGFGPGEKVRQAIDEEQGPRLVFADGTQSIYLADLSGDGLTDLVRIRNGEVCYWPNLGYARFGAKVSMDNAPWFDAPDMFDQRRIRLADIDGSGLVDILYLTANGVHLYFNQSGNAWSERRTLSTFPRIDNLSSVSTLDLLGNGTACLVWSSPLPGDARSALRYIDLMGGQKPHLLIKTKNNLGAETTVEYASSTKFYLQDKQAGKPWITKLPFPVHVVTKSTVTDKWRNTKFSTSYSYHHGYFDGVEREFRGFARVEQLDVESYGEFVQGNIASPYITDNHELFQPPIKSVTWYHTGAAFERDRILSTLRQEYFVVPGFAEHDLPEPTVTPAAELSAEEWREAMRACKGMVLRQEVFELDVDALSRNEELPVRLFTTAYHNSDIKRLQAQGVNRHAVFLVTESEAITYNYELDLRQADANPDPRIAHTLNLSFDDYGRALQTVAVVYPRHEPYVPPADTLSTAQLNLINTVQTERHIAYSETHMTAPLATDPYQHRLPAPCEVLTYELSGDDNTDGFTPSAGDYFTLNDFRSFNLTEALPGQGTRPVNKLEYHQQPGNDKAHMRIVEWVRMLYFTDDLSGAKPFGEYAWHGWPYETYKLALTQSLLEAVFAEKLTPEVLSQLDTAALSGYLPGTRLTPAFTDQWWMRSGVAGFADDAALHFYLPEKYTDPFGNVTTLRYDSRDLFIQSSTDALGNTAGIATDPGGKPRFDYRVLAPIAMVDANGNHTEVAFDILGMVVASAVKGKGSEADDLVGFDDALANPSSLDVQAFCTASVMNETTARAWLGHATARFVYHFGEQRDALGKVSTWAERPAGACGIAREIHFNTPGGADSPLQVSLDCSDGSGNVLMKKVQAEPDSTLPPAEQQLRWIINGLTVLNNKGKPVKQYEPAFSADFGCEMPRANGVTPILYYGAAGRVVRTELPDGTFSRVEFTPWHALQFDASDTVLESTWYAERMAPGASDEDHRAARLSALHSNTPGFTVLDSLGREVITIAHNRSPSDAPGDRNIPLIDRLPWLDERHFTYSKLDAEGKPLWIRDARGNLVMQYIYPPMANNDPSELMPIAAVPCYDIAGNLLFQHSMDAGDRWMLSDAAGKPLLGWDMNERITDTGETVIEQRVYHTTYDALHRPRENRLSINGETAQVVERFVYGEALPEAAATSRNLRGQVLHHYDPSGRVTNEAFDFKSNLLAVTRRLASAFDAPVIDWPEDLSDAGLEEETYRQRTEYDALNRMRRLENWHLAGRAPAIYSPQYNARGALQSEKLTVHGQVTEAVRNIEYDAKGQRQRIQYGNGTTTRYHYDPKTFRLLQLRTTRTGTGGSLPSLPSNLSEPNALQNLYYTYDPAGNISEIHDDAYEPVFFNNQRVEPRSRYTYDALHRLIEATGRENIQATDAPGQIEAAALPLTFQVTDQALRNYAQRYIYDSVGNFIEMRHAADGGNWTRHYETATDSNRLLRTWTGSDESSAVRYDYDSHGSMLNFANVPDEFRTRWDYRDMISDVNLGGGGHAWYNYDAGKQRTRKRIVRLGGAVEDRVYLGGMERYRSYTSSGEEVVEEIETHHLFVDDQRVLLVDDVLSTDSTALGKGLLYKYQYSNHLGSVGLELDKDAAIISYEEYHPYGTSAYQANGAGVRATAKLYRYTGMERDEETGLSYHTARYYLPWLGRWGSADPIGLAGGIDLYAYVNNRPNCLSDSSGEQPIDGDQARAYLGTYRGEYASASPSRLRELTAFTDILEREAGQLEQDIVIGKLAVASYADSSVLPEGWSRVDAAGLGRLGIDADDMSSERSGLSSSLYFNASRNEYVLAFRGTEPSSAKDWAHDASQAGGTGSSQYTGAMRLAESVNTQISRSGANLILTGHSLGGGLASAAAVITGRTAVTFNAAGLHENTIPDFLRFNRNMSERSSGARADELTRAAHLSSRAYTVEGEAVSLIQNNRTISDVASLTDLGGVPQVIGINHLLKPVGTVASVRQMAAGAGDVPDVAASFLAAAVFHMGTIVLPAMRAELISLRSEISARRILETTRRSSFVGPSSFVRDALWMEPRR
jgi:RHS repeat-associated protein